jgi:hypothetical protein
MTYLIFLFLSMGWAMNVTELKFSFERSETSRDANSFEEYIEIVNSQAYVGERRGGYRPHGHGDMPATVYKLNAEILKKVAQLIEKHGFTTSLSETPEAPAHNRVAQRELSTHTYSMKLDYTADKKPVRISFYMVFHGAHRVDDYRDQPLFKKLSAFRRELDSLVHEGERSSRPVG